MTIITVIAKETSVGGGVAGLTEEQAMTLGNIDSTTQITAGIATDIESKLDNLMATPKTPTGGLLVMPASAATPAGHTTLGYPNLGFSIGNTNVTGFDAPYALNTGARLQVGPANNTMYSAVDPKYVYVSSLASDASAGRALPLYILNTETGVVATQFANFPIATAAYPCEQGCVSATGNGFYAIGVPALSYTTPASAAITYADATTGTWTIKPIGPAQLGGIVESVLVNNFESLIFIGGWPVTSTNLNGATLPSLARIQTVGHKVRRYEPSTGSIFDLPDLPFFIAGAQYRKVGNTIVGTCQLSSHFHEVNSGTWNTGKYIVFKLVFNADYTNYTVQYQVSTSTTFQTVLGVEIAGTDILVFKTSATAGFVDVFKVVFGTQSSVDTAWQLIEMPSYLRVAQAYMFAGTKNMAGWGLYSGITPVLKAFQTPTLGLAATGTVRPLTLGFSMYGNSPSTLAGNMLGLTVINLPTSTFQTPWSTDSTGTPVAFKLVVKN